MSKTREGVGTLVIGAGQAGLQLATSLRQFGETGPITLVGGEPRPPYQRPPLSKDFLHGKLTEQSLALRAEVFYRDHGLRLVTAEWVDAVALTDPRRGAGEAVTRSGRRLEFDRLAVTAGGTPLRLAVPGHDLGGIHYLRDLDDALSLQRDLDPATHVVVVGGGFIGLEVAANATRAGKRVTVVEAAERLLQRAVAPVTADFYAAAHRRRGTAVLLGTEVMAFSGRHQVEAVTLTDGRILRADVVVVGIGMMPHTGLAEQVGLACADGIVVDERARTSIPAVVAAGDCTVIDHPGRGLLRHQSVQNAIAQAKVAAASLIGAPVPDTGTPWFWSDQADLKLKIAGINAGYDQVVLRGSPATEQFSVLYYGDGRLLAIDAVNSPREYLVVRRILASGGNVPVDKATNTSVGLEDLAQVST